MTSATRSVEDRLLALEDRQAIYQVVCGYGYSVDGCNADSVGNFYVEDGVYEVGDMPAWVGREAIAGITREAGHLKLVQAGCAHMSTLPFVVIDGDHAVATCHTMVPMRGEKGFFIGRLSASRIELARQADGRWKIVYRQNFMLDGKPEGPALLSRLRDGPNAERGSWQ
ncbi:nuclear transport factor 2 family protein [Novosphingobium sp. G106]|uniref:nuclear transport factor 2 family protein n=1 Tax=Novosphingobium sp. G106 TaxID=2849500 RepID=UPI001C2DA0F2|nr:nuclear transport factor 2 family protein [Novosphingobium sp. G106]MBV1689010.1 nuclear transport factor 2 family protein [Novosphingobium sp. G106]